MKVKTLHYLFAGIFFIVFCGTDPVTAQTSKTTPGDNPIVRACVIGGMTMTGL